MSSLRTHRAVGAFAVIALVLLALTLFAACGDGDTDIEPTATEPGATAQGATPTADGTIRLGSEAGEGPIFWRTEDNFESLRAGEPYKVLFRITSGYDGETLRIVAEREAGGQQMEFEANRAEPEGEEAPGSFYPFNLELPDPGNWVLTVVAGDDEVAIPVVVEPSGGSTRY